jgi:hypothetical protein
MIDRIDDRVFSIAYDKTQRKSPVRLEASRKYVVDVWREDWHDDAAVIARMDTERAAYLPEMEKRAQDDFNSIGVYRLDC